MHNSITFLMTRLLLVCSFLCLQYLKKTTTGLKLIFMGIIISDILLLPWQLFCIC